LRKVPEMTKPFQDNPEKHVVRELWDTAILEFLHRKFNVRYRYLGLPGVDLIDVRLWQKMIDEVIAFEPRDQTESGRTHIEALRRNMQRFGVPGVAYFGSFEEVVMLRMDYDGQKYSQDKLVTLYNLDFCNEITSAVETLQGKRVWRFEAIRQILRDQAACYEQNKGPRHFIMMLTVRDQTSGKNIQPLLSGSGLLAQAKAHHDSCIELNPIRDPRKPLIGTHTWALKVAVFNSLYAYFGNPCLSALFFPPVRYKGTRARTTDKNGRATFMQSPMLHWLILCRFAEREQPGAICLPHGFLGRSCVAVESGKSFVWDPQTGEKDGSPNPPDSVVYMNQFGGPVLQGL
jgi:hypothetical protein